MTPVELLSSGPFRGERSNNAHMVGDTGIEPGIGAAPPPARFVAGRRPDRDLSAGVPAAKVAERVNTHGRGSNLVRHGGPFVEISGAAS
jgi:hypothetical protein